MDDWIPRAGNTTEKGRPPLFGRFRRRSAAFSNRENGDLDRVSHRPGCFAEEPVADLAVAMASQHQEVDLLVVHGSTEFASRMPKTQDAANRSATGAQRAGQL